MAAIFAPLPRELPLRVEVALENEFVGPQN